MSASSPPAADSAGLSAAQLAAFQRDGFLILRAFSSPPAVAALAAGVESLLARLEAEAAAAGGSADERMGVFAVAEQARSASDAYFLASADRVAPFLEPAAAAAAGPGAAAAALRGRLNKVGHNLHELEPAFCAATLGDARVAAVCRSLGFARPAVPQSMLILKPPRVGGAVPPHVDGAFLHTTPQSVVGFWTPLERCTRANACLWAVPGSHAAPVRRLFRRNAAGTGTEFAPAEPHDFDTAGAVPLEMDAGDMLLLHAAVVHFSEANTGEASRHAYSWHVVETGKGVVYDADNWLQRRTGAFPTLYSDE